jgi:hypothetical protein
MNLPPIRPPSGSPQDMQRFCREVSERLQTVTLNQSASLLIQPVHGFGTNVEIRRSSISTAGDTFPQPLHMVLRGEWDDEADYSVGDVVVIIGSANAGTYCCVTLSPAGSPEPGTVGSTAWFKLADGFRPVVWE